MYVINTLNPLALFLKTFIFIHTPFGIFDCFFTNSLYIFIIISKSNNVNAFSKKDEIDIFLLKIDFEKSQEAYARAQSDRAEIQNQRYRSAVGAAITGAASGVYHGVTTGIKATKIEDIPKQIKEGTKKNNEALAAREKWLDAGGTTTISQIKSSIQKDVGILTDAQVTDMQIKNYDSQISTNKRLLSSWWRS